MTLLSQQQKLQISCLNDFLNTLKIRIADPNKQLVKSFVNLTGMTFELMSEKDGEIEIYTEGGDYYLSQIKDKKNELIIEKIRSQEFSWNYYHMVDGKGGTTNQTTHINFLQIKCEIILETGKELKIMRELNQWESVKAGWKYKLLEVNDESEILITTNTLEKLKQLVEGNTPIKAEGVYAADMKNGQN